MYRRSKKRRKQKREREIDYIRVDIHTLWLPRARGSSCTLFSINIDPIHIGRAINSAISPRRVCLSFGSASKFIDRDEEDFERRRDGNKTMREKSVAGKRKRKRYHARNGLIIKVINRGASRIPRARARVIFKSYLIIARQISESGSREINPRRDRKIVIFSRDLDE